MKKLKAGAKIYKIYRNRIDHVIEIEKTTKTQAISKDGYRFKIDYSDSKWISIIGNTEYNMYTYRLETPELADQFFRHHLTNKIEKVIFDSLTTSKLIQIDHIINEQ